MTRDEAIKATKTGAIAACVSAAVTGIAYFIAAANEVERFDDFGFLNDPMLMFDVVLLLVLAFFIYKKSRVASVVILLYFILSKIFLFLETGKIQGVFVSVLFIYFYARAAWGSFVFHKDEKLNNPNYRTTPKWILIGTSALGAVLIGLIGLGTLTMTSVMTPTEVLPGDQLNSAHVESLIETGLVGSVEDIEMFYSTSLKDIKAEGTILLKDKVILYMTPQGGDFQAYEIVFNDIVDVSVVEPGGPLSDAVYKLSGEEENNWMQISLSTERGGDKKFIEIVKARMSK